MPVVDIKHSFNHIVTGIWRITESLDQLIPLSRVSGNELSECLAWKNQHRQKEWLGTRALLSAMMSPVLVKIGYHPDGKPFIKDQNSFISISHSRDFIAVAVSTSVPVGIDIETMHPRIRKITSKFLNNSEISDTGKLPSLLTLYYYWCCKEAVYKAHPRTCHQFRDDIYVHPFDYLCTGQTTGQAEVKDKSGLTVYQMLPGFFDEMVMVLCFQKGLQ